MTNKLPALILTAFFSVAVITAALLLSDQKAYTGQAGHPVINEFMASNSSTLRDEDSDASDWIEIYNPSPEPINLKGYTLSDNRRNEPWVFPEVLLPPGGYLIVWASGKNRPEPGREEIASDGAGRDTAGANRRLINTANVRTNVRANIGAGGGLRFNTNLPHTDFRLRETGELINLFDPQGKLIDGLVFSRQTTDHSFGRIPGRNEWAYFAEPTPGAENTAGFAAGITSPPVLSLKSGLFPHSVEVTISAPEGEKIYYTLDGSVPDINSRLYEKSIIADITTVLRAVSAAPGLHPSLPVTATYIIAEDYGLPVLSVVTDPENLWDAESGILNNPHQRGERWERSAAVSLIRPDGSVVFDFEHDIGLRVHGQASRGNPKKSFRLYWRGGTYLEYPLFANKPEITRFRRLIVRSGGNDHATGWDGNQTWVMMRCWLLGELWRQAGGNASSHIPVILLLNGSMRGMYTIRERIDRFFLQENFGVDPDNVDLIKYENYGVATVQEGSIEEWNSLHEFFKNSDLTDPEAYSRAHELIDVNNFTDYAIMQIYAGNWDWPQNNVFAFRERTHEARWRWILWDVDDAFILRTPINHNTLQWGTRDTARSDLAPPWYVQDGATSLHTTVMLRRLLENDEYREFFISRAIYLLNTVLRAEHVIQEIMIV